MVKIIVKAVPGTVATGPQEDIASWVGLAVPQGRPKRVIDRLTATLTAVQRDAYGQAVLDLIDAGVWDKLDMLCIRGRNSADSLMNWARTGSATLTGGVFALGAGIALNGVSDFIDMNVAAQRMTLTSACAFAYATAAPGTASVPLIGRVSGVDDVARLYPYSSSGTTALARLGSVTSLTAAYTGVRTGFWGVSRSGTNVAVLRNGVSLGAATLTADFALTTLAVGRNSGAFGTFTVSAWGYGAFLTPAEQARLQAVIEAIGGVV